MHYPEIPERDRVDVFHCYSDKLTFTDVHFHIGEMLAGHEESKTKFIWNVYEYEPGYDLDSCYIMISGLSQKIYRGVFEWGQTDSLNCFIYSYRPFVKRLLLDSGYDGDSYIFLFDGRKHYVTIFSKVRENTVPPIELAEQANKYLQKIYEDYLFERNTEYANFTSVTRQPLKYDEISEAFFKCRDVLKYYFFLKESKAIDEKWVNENVKTFPVVDYEESIIPFRRAIEKLDLESTLAYLDIILFNIISPSFDFKELDTFLLTIRNIMDRCKALYGLKNDIRPEQFSIETYPHIFACRDSMEQIISETIERINGTMLQKKKLISLSTLNFIRTHFNNPELNVNKIADVLGVTPNYLTTVFKTDIGVPVHQYIEKIRMERASELLATTDMNIDKISSEVGYAYSKYFSRAYKKYYGISPAEYRQTNTIKEKTEEAIVGKVTDASKET